MTGRRHAGEKSRTRADLRGRAAGRSAARWLAITAAMLAAGPSYSPGAPARIESVRVGVAGAYKVGAWTPVRITVAAGETPFRGQLDISTEDSDGADTHFVDGPGEALTAPPAGRTSVWRYVKFGRVRGELKVVLRDEQGRETGRPWRLPNRSPALLATRQWIVVVGKSVGVEDAVRSRRFGAAAEWATTRIEDVGDLPDRWHGYSGIDWLILTTSRESPFSRMTDAQIAALVQWVRLGGRMVLCVGEQGEEVLGEGGRLQVLNPGRLVRVIPQRNTAGLETYAGATERLGGAGAGPNRAPLMMTVLADVRGRTEAFEGLAAAGKQPIIVRYPFGFGQLVFAAFDLDQPPLATWPARPRLAARLLGGASEDSEEGSDVGGLGQVAHVGYEDVSGQLRSALDQFSRVMLVPFSWIAGLLIVYIALIGPGDYFFLKKVVGRMHWSWLTFPFLVVLFGLLAFWLFENLKSRRLQINQVDLVDVDVSESIVRGAVWAHLYSPRTDTYDLALAPARALDESPDSPALLAWQGLPGKGLGGFNTTTPPPFRLSYEIVSSPVAGDEPAGTIRGLPIQVAATRCLFGQWWSPAEIDGEARLSATPDGLLRGEIRNILPVELTGGMVFYGLWAYRLEESLQPGQTVRVGDQPLNLEWQLTRRRLVEMNDVAAPWDPGSRDVPRILEMMMFYEAAGGRSYTHLLHRHQGRFDLSGHLATGRAILVARGAERASSLVRDNQPLGDNYQRTWTFYRIVFPVAPAERLRVARKAANP